MPVFIETKKRGVLRHPPMVSVISYQTIKKPRVIAKKQAKLIKINQINQQDFQKNIPNVRQMLDKVFQKC